MAAAISKPALWSGSRGRLAARQRELTGIDVAIFELLHQTENLAFDGLAGS
jgi:hypothetical protein